KINRHGGFPSLADSRRNGYGDLGARKIAMDALLADLAGIPELARALDNVRRLPPPCYDDETWSFVEALLDVLPRCAARLRIVFARSGAIDFAEATLIALHALGDADSPSDLLLALDMRIEHLLVDEFQDTSLAQYELIECITDGWTAGDGGPLLVVGDPMHSTYR